MIRKVLTGRAGGRWNPTPVGTTRIAPTILKALGLDPDSLQAVRMEHTVVLPGLKFDKDEH